MNSFAIAFKSRASVLSLCTCKNTIGLDNPCSLLEKLYDNLVTPVMLYYSEIWGLTCAEKDTTPYEYLHLKFIKEILGVHSKTSNDACRAELNRLPLRDKILNLSFNYWQHELNRLPLRDKILNLAFNYWQHLWSSSNSLVSTCLR